MAKNGNGAGRRRATGLVVLAEVAAVLLVGGAALVAALTGEPEPAAGPTATVTPAPTTPAAQADGTAPVIRPGRPGESAEVLRPDQISPGTGPTPNAADVRFVRMMIPHHEQALAMAALAPQRAGSAAVIAIADRIRAVQQPEVEVLRSWLRDRGLDPGSAEHGGHDARTRHGMQSPEAIAALAAATGTDFDRRFVEMMTEHHEGAIQMAQEVLTSGVDPQIRELARNIAFEQAVEIGRMREALGLPTR
ncbi:DUF305 domain-containing protein [Micromonospora sp. HM5-17]|uniref:DUF305 domain-containing protein n=1 Tax=Micromonospora sp. HM5-17 TaxID=2487710 RepID=UPI001F3017E2|nr:DUF305 domain-containing protein [Micromonospora sp. HM5-17]